VVLSPRNPRVKRLARLARSRRARADDGVFVVEGPTLVAEALDGGTAVEGIYVEEGAATDLVARAGALGVPVHVLAAGGLRGVVDARTPQPVAALACTPVSSVAAAAAAPLVLVLVGVADPGNVGTLVRTAEATGASVICCGGADPFSAKAVRASAGSVLRVPVAVVAGDDAEAVLEHLGGTGHRRLATRPTGGVPYDSADLEGDLAVVLGSEAHGLPPGLDEHRDDLLDLSVSIPMDGRAESLNVAMAGTVICFEAARRRRDAGL